MLGNKGVRGTESVTLLSWMVSTIFKELTKVGFRDGCSSLSIPVKDN